MDSKIKCKILINFEKQFSKYNEQFFLNSLEKTIRFSNY